MEATDSLAAPTLPQFTFQDAYRAGLDQRPELASLDARERAQENLKDAARNLRLPSVVASASYGSTGLQTSTWVSTYTVNAGGAGAAVHRRPDLGRDRQGPGGALQHPGGAPGA